MVCFVRVLAKGFCMSAREKKRSHFSTLTTLPEITDISYRLLSNHLLVHRLPLRHFLFFSFLMTFCNRLREVTLAYAAFHLLSCLRLCRDSQRVLQCGVHISNLAAGLAPALLRLQPSLLSPRTASSPRAEVSISRLQDLHAHTAGNS
jgi:hypothetical protein